MRFSFNSAAAACVRRALSSSSHRSGGSSSKAPWSPTKMILVAGTAIGVTGGCVWAWQREESRGARRSADFWMQIFPIFLHYKWTQHVTCMSFSLSGRTPIDEATADEHWHALHQKYASRVHGIMTNMGGFYFKTGQLLSTRDDFVPPEYLGFFKQLQDAAPPRAFEHVKSVIERELGRDIKFLFKKFEETACGAASIGQVHRAVLPNGNEVAVKVMYPGVEQMFRSDLKTVKDFCRLAMPQHLPALDEIERQFVTEFDYRKEGANLNEVAQNLSGVWDHVAVVPRAHLHMCTHNVLVMDYLPGVKLVSAIRAQFARFAVAQGKTMEQLEAELKATQGSVKPPSKRVVQMYTLWLKFSDGMKNVPIMLRNWLGAWWGLKPLPLVHTEVPINLYHIIDVMLRVHAHELFVDGCFNGDPHPGNILLLPDGRLGLIDYGQVKRLTLDERISYAKLICALAREDRAAIVRWAHGEGKLKTKKMSEDKAWRMLQFFNNRDDADVTNGMSVPVFMDWLEELDPIISINDTYVMCGNLSMLLRGVSRAFGIPCRLAVAFQPIAAKLLLENGVDPLTC